MEIKVYVCLGYCMICDDVNVSYIKFDFGSKLMNVGYWGFWGYFCKDIYKYNFK